jgi:hypothetical protein
MSGDDAPEIAALCRLKWPDEGRGLSWSELEEKVGKPRTKFRSAMRRYKRDHPDEFEGRRPRVIDSRGVLPESYFPDEEEVFDRACREWERTQRLMAERANQRLVFDHGPVALVETADWHMGGQGVDYPRLDEELRLMTETPGMWVVGAGDLLDQFILSSLRWTRDNNRLAIRDEWVLLRRMLKIIAPKLLVVVSGNHDNWLEMLTGISYFERELRDLKPDVLYDTDDVVVTVQVGDWKLPTRIRHQWTGSSIYNPTHGIERAAKWDQNFVIGMGAHTHRSGVTRTMNVGGVTGMAMMAGAYKRDDPYARRKGFALPNASTSVAVVIDEEHRSLTGFNNLAACADYMQELY